MELTGRVAVVTGGARGIGAALARALAAAGAAHVVVADRDTAGAAEVAAAVGGTGFGVDVGVEAEVAGLVRAVVEQHGRLDLLCANAGITTGAGLDATDDDWSRAWSVNVLAHIYAARAAVPVMLEQGGGHLLFTCSAAGLLTAVGDAPYAVTKHAAVAHAEWLAITYGDRGIGVSALCPQGVDTAMLQTGLAAGHLGARITAASGAVLSAEEVAAAAVEGISAGRFLILPHPEVAEYERRRATDRERWLSSMRRIVAGLR